MKLYRITIMIKKTFMTEGNFTRSRIPIVLPFEIVASTHRVAEAMAYDMVYEFMKEYEREIMRNDVEDVDCFTDGLKKSHLTQVVHGGRLIEQMGITVVAAEEKNESIFSDDLILCEAAELQEDCIEV